MSRARQINRSKCSLAWTLSIAIVSRSTKIYFTLLVHAMRCDLSRQKTLGRSNAVYVITGAVGRRNFFSKLQRDRYSVGITTRTRDDIINPVSATNIFQASHATPPVPSLSVAHFWNALIERLAHPRAARRDRWFNASLSIVRWFLALAGSRLRKATCTWAIRFFRQALSSLSPREHRKRCSMKENNRYGVSMNDVAYRGSSGRAHFTRLLANVSCNSRSR